MKRWLLWAVLAIAMVAVLPPILVLLRDRKPTGTIAPVDAQPDRCCTSAELTDCANAPVDGTNENAEPAMV